NANPAFVMGGLCIVGGLIGFARTRSIPSISAGLVVGLLYLWSANHLKNGSGPGLEGALGASALLLLSSAPRAAKGPVPALLTVTSAASTYYYGSTFLALRK
ncbi:transmembrane proteins 14C-domain-containing protein, partial [Cristinia sonorae]